ncbi:MAG: phage terminase large subunit [Candidatus Acidiferrales bacterium]
MQKCFHEHNPETEYFHNWHIEVIVEALEQCRLGKLRRLIINVPPRSLKSHMASIVFPAWLLGHNPAVQIICVSYAQGLSDKLAADCRSVMGAQWYQDLFPATRLAMRKPAVNDYTTTKNGCRVSTSMGGGLTGRGADFIIIDDPLKPDEALSETQRTSVNNCYDNTLVSRLNSKRDGCIILIQQRLHEDDLVGHVMKQGDWKILMFPAIADENETHIIETPYGRKTFKRQMGEVLHEQREPLELLRRMREIQGEYIFAGQYQQSPAPLGGGMIKASWFKTYSSDELPKEFEVVVQSWDTANKCTELSDYSVCTTWGLHEGHLYLLHVMRKRMDYPNLKRAVMRQAQDFKADNVVIEDRASGTQLIQDLIADGMQTIARYEPKLDKVMRMNWATTTIENGFVHLPAEDDWLTDYLYEMAVFPNGKYDDQVDSTSQGLDWFKDFSANQTLGLLEYQKQMERAVTREADYSTIPQSRPCEGCGGVMKQPIPSGLRCAQCGAQWPPPGAQRSAPVFNRADALNGRRFG